MRKPYLLIFSTLMVVLCFSACELPREKTQEERMEELMRFGGIDPMKVRRPGSGSSASGRHANWRIRVTRVRVSNMQGGGLATLWTYTDENVRIAAGKAFANTGLRAGYARGNFGVQLNSWRQSSQSSDVQSTHLLVQNGRTGVIQIGETMFLQPFTLDGRAYGGDVVKVAVGQSMVVTPRAGPDGTVLLRLAPQFTNLKGVNGALQIDSLATTVVLQPGQPLVLGGGSSGHTKATGSLFQHHRNSENHKTLLIVQVDG